MGFLKWFGTAMLGFLLFISLFVFNTAFLLNSTLLSPGFITKQVNRLDLPEIARDVIGEQIDQELPVNIDLLESAAYDIVKAEEPWLKSQADAVIKNTYDYLRGKTTNLQINVPLSTIKQNLKNDLWLELNKQLPVWLRDNRNDLESYIMQNLTQYRALLPPEVAALPDAQLNSYLDTFLQQVSQSPALTGLLATLVKPYFDHYYDEFAADIPDTQTAGDIPSDVMDQLQTARMYIGYFRQGFYALIVFMLLLVAGIFLIHRNIQDPSRSLGIDLALYGVLDLVGVMVVRTLNLPDRIPVPVYLEPWLNAMFNDIFRIMLILAIVTIVLGAALITVSFVIKKTDEA